MNLPIGETIFELEKKDVLEKMKELMKKNFSGYICITIHSQYGVEDSALLFKDGKAIAAFYEFLNFNKTIFSEKALEGFLNALRCKSYVANCYRLTSHQIDLIVAFNEHLKFKREYTFIQLKKLIPKKYEEFAEKILSLPKEEISRIEILRKFGLEKL